MKLSIIEPKVMVFKCKELIRTNIIINDQIMEQVNHFDNLGNDIGYDINYDIDVKFGKFRRICGKINRIFINKVRP